MAFNSNKPYSVGTLLNFLVQETISSKPSSNSDSDFVNVSPGDGNLSTGGEVSVSLTSPVLKQVSYVVEEFDGNISGYDVVLRVFETDSMSNQIGNDIPLNTGASGQVSDTVDCPRNHVQLVVKNNDGSKTGSVDIAAQGVT